MKKLILLCAVFSLAAIPAQAQSEHPRFEVFAGYSHFSADVGLDDPFDDDGDPFFRERLGMHGFAFSGAGYFSKNLGFVGDFSYHKREIELPGPDIDFSTFNFLFGPRFTARGDRVEGFGHALIGGVRRRVENGDSDIDLALGFGGGVDIKVSRNFAVRLVQLDYIPFRDRDFFTGDKEWRHNLRVGIGVTFRIE
jgi:opacity protein-like surface antigen